MTEPSFVNGAILVITRRGVLLAGGIGLLASHPLSHGQAAGTIRRVAWFSIGSRASPHDGYAAFTQGMHDLGWREGKNVEYQRVYADGEVSRLDALASELVRQTVDVIVVGNATTARAFQRATKTVPIVMGSVNNPVGNGLVASLAKPGGNITGIATQSDEVLGKLVEILHEVAPGARRIAFLLNETTPSYSAYWSAAQSACAALELDAQRILANVPAQLDAAVKEIVRQRSQAVVVAADPLYLNERANLHALMQGTRLPGAYSFREHVVAGGLLSYGVDQVATYRHAAAIVDKILKGARPSDLPVEQPTAFELVINLKTAKALGLSIPAAVLARADGLIQ
jgi:putative ABC transport system substrate-binding protein